jgi:undecaprenyl-diphosphatase
MNLEIADSVATAAINQFSGRSFLFDAVIMALSVYGVYAIVAAVAVRWWWVGNSNKQRERHLAILCGASVACGLLINQCVLLFAHRIRPYDAGVTHLLFAPSADPSFPSDHATLAFAVAFALLFASARRGWIFLVAAAAIAASRVYVGTHYVSDVLGGAATALIAAAICVTLIKPDAKITQSLVRIL